MKSLNDEFLVKSFAQPNDPRHFVTVTSSGTLNCDKSCPKFQDEKFCSHVISAAIKYKLLESNLAVLSKERISR